MVRASNDTNHIGFTLKFIWIPKDLGGHAGPPYTGMRLSIRWQQHVEAHLECARDVRCQILDFDPKTSKGHAICVLASVQEIPGDWVHTGQLVELLNGFRVLAIGKVV